MKRFRDPKHWNLQRKSTEKTPHYSVRESGENFWNRKAENDYEFRERERLEQGTRNKESRERMKEREPLYLFYVMGRT